MKEKFLKIFGSNLLIKGSLVIFIGSVLANVSSYLFHLLMGRFLGPENYGVLESLISITYFLGIPLSVLILVMVKFISENKERKDIVSSFVIKVIKKTTLWGILLFILFMSFFPILKNLVKTDSFILFLGVGLFSFIGIYSSIFSAVFQGFAEFVKYSFLNIFNVWVKLIIAVGFVLLGLKLGGAIYSIVISTALTVLLGYKLSQKHLNFNTQKSIDIGNLIKKVKPYSLSVLIFNLSMTSFYTIDIILAKYFLPANQAGQYAALSVLGKIIFYASSPLVAVMFPLIAEKYSKGEKYTNMFWQSFTLIVMVSGAVSVIYYLFPETMIGLLFGKEYLWSAKYLGVFSLFISIYSLCSLFLNYFLSTSKTKPVFVSLFFALVQIIMISFFHDTIGEIIKSNVLSVSLLLLSLLVIYYFDGKKKTSFSYSSGL